MTKRNKTVPVLDSQNHVLSSTTPAKARLLLKNGNYTVFQENPFMIKQNGEMKEIMPKRKTRSSVSFVSNWTKFFEEECEIYIQNLGSTNIQMTIKQDGDPVSISIPNTKKPLNLTQFATFDALKGSTELRAKINRNPPMLRIVSEEEYEQFYNDLADKYGTNPEDEMRIAQSLFSALMNHDEALLIDSEDIENNSEELLSPKEPLPKVAGICARTDKDHGKDRLKERAAMEELDIIEDQMEEKDWKYIIENINPTYKKVAERALEALQSLN